MSEYIVSARKYRPDSFESLIGQDNIARTLKNSIQRGQLAHAYLFCGPRGVGKTSTARIFAKAINCSNPGADMEPCGECESCQSFAEGRSYCIHELDAASNNGVEDIKALMDKVQIPPQVGRYSVYIIDEVHMLSQSAFNAFLKTLEEPPAHAIFILCTTEKHKILPTILSRCQTYDFNRIAVGDIIRNLQGIAAKEGVTIGDESLHVIARKADGAMRDALTIFDQTVAFCGQNVKYEDVLSNLNVLDYEYGFKLVDAALAGDYATALLTLDDVLTKGFNAQYFVTSLGEHLRDLLVSRTAGLEALLDFPESLKQRYAAQAQRCSVKFIYDALGVTTACEAGYKAAANQRLHIEFALMKLCFLLSMAPEQKAADANLPLRSIPSRPADVPPVLLRNASSQLGIGNELPLHSPAASVHVATGGHGFAAAPSAPSTTEEKPAVAAPTAPQPAPAIKPVQPAKKPGGFSLSALMSAKEEEKVVVAEEAKAEPMPEQEAAAKAWQTVAASKSAQPRLCSTLTNAKLKFSEEGGSMVMEFDVINESQKSWIEEKMLRSLEEEVRKELASSRIRLVVGVVPAEEHEAPIYMPADKAKVLVEENAEVRQFVKDFELEVL